MVNRRPTQPVPPPPGEHNPVTPPPEKKMAGVTALRPAPPQGHPPVIDDAPSDLSTTLGVVGEGSADTGSMVAGLVGLRRKRADPMNDWVGDGTRKLRWIQSALAHEAELVGLTRQELETQVLLGQRQLSPELLDAHFVELYGRSRHDPVA